MNWDKHLASTFEENERMFPDLMEPYSGRLADAHSADEKVAIMRAGLRETIARRYPLAEAREVAAVPPSQQQALEL